MGCSSDSLAIGGGGGISVGSPRPEVSKKHEILEPQEVSPLKPYDLALFKAQLGEPFLGILIFFFVFQFFLSDL